MHYELSKLNGDDSRKSRQIDGHQTPICVQGVQLKSLITKYVTVKVIKWYVLKKVDFNLAKPLKKLLFQNVWLTFYKATACSSTVWTRGLNIRKKKSISFCKIAEKTIGFRTSNHLQPQFSQDRARGVFAKKLATQCLKCRFWVPIVKMVWNIPTTEKQWLNHHTIFKKNREN